MFFTVARSLVFCLTLFISLSTFAQPSNNVLSASVPSVTPLTSCGSLTGQTLLQATSDGITSTCHNTTRDVWYKFTTPTNVTAVSLGLSNTGSDIATNNTYIEAYNAAVYTDVTSTRTLGCDDVGAGLALSSLTPNTTYFFRVFTRTNTSTGNWGFSVCVSYLPPPSNDECSAATSLSIGATNTSGTVWSATASTGIPAVCSGTPDDDVWYQFTASSSSASINLSSIGTDLSTSGARLQVFSGACGALTSIACGNTSVTALGLTYGNIYYVRVYSASSGSIGGTPAGSAFSITVTNPTSLSSTTVNGGRMNEVFKQTTLSAANVLNDPWEITYGTDGFLWITEARGYKVYRMDPTTGAKSTVLDISQGSTFLPTSEQSFNVQFSSSQDPWPQGGFAGLALHPKFLDATSPKNYVYVSYVHSYDHNYSADSTGYIFTNRIVRFTYNTASGRLQDPVSLCDTLPGSNDHNSQRMIIAPVGSTYYLFYASGDMGALQYKNTHRPIRAQDVGSYEGKILRFNLEETGASNQWIPDDNPFNGAKESAVWSTGIRNNQGFAFATINGTDYLYGSSHGPHSDDEINIIERGKNYGHPDVIGYSSDGNYDGSSPGNNKCNYLITSEAANAAAIGISYKDPIFSAYASPKATINNIYLTSPANSGWPSEGWSGMDIYTNNVIPGWKNSLVLAALKWGRLIRLKLNTNGNGIVSSAGKDTVGYFDSQNRFRDIAYAPNGKDVFVIMDKSPASSGPSTNNPSIVSCAGCVQKYTFLGYQPNSSTGRSSISSAIDIAGGSANTVTAATTVTIDADNSNLWVPITGPDGNILAEIKANGNILGTVTSSFYTHSGSAREDASKKLYLNRSITITPQNQPTSTVNVRLYITGSELASLMSSTNSNGFGSGVGSISDIKILKNNDANSAALTAAASIIAPTYAEAHSGTNSGGYVLQADITSFSSFYFGNPSMTTLPLELISFKGTAKEEAAHLDWETEHESNTNTFIVERSVDGRSFEAIGSVEAKGTASVNAYNFIDAAASKLSSRTVYYRLKMIDIDGAYQYSKVINVAFESPISLVNVYPNPVEDIMNLKLSSARAYEVQILVTDMQGRRMFTQAKRVAAGVNEIKIDTKSWPSQSYTLQILNGQKEVIVSRKIVKM